MKKKSFRALVVIIVIAMVLQMAPITGFAADSSAGIAETTVLPTEEANIPQTDTEPEPSPDASAQPSAEPSSSTEPETEPNLSAEPSAQPSAAVSIAPQSAAASVGESGGDAAASVEPASTAQSAGSFYFMALSGSEIAAKPIKVDYAAGDTIASALTKTKYTFEGLEKNEITKVNEIAGNYARASSEPTEGALDRLDATPEPLSGKLLVFQAGVENFTVSKDLALLAAELVRYENSEDAQRYTVAINLYNGIQKDLATALTDNSFAAERYAALKNAIDAAEGQFEGTPRAVSVTLMHGESELQKSEAQVVFTNQFGTNFTAASGDTIELLPADYTFTASIPALNKQATGKFTVEALEESTAANSPTEQMFDLTFPGDDYWLAAAAFVPNATATDSTTKTLYNPVDSTSLDFFALDTVNNSTARWGIMWSDGTQEFDGGYRTATAVYTSVVDGTTQTCILNRVMSSVGNTPANYLYDFIPEDGSGRSSELVAELVDAENDTVFKQTYTVNLVRQRTLSNLRVLQSGGAAVLAPDFSANTYEYIAQVLEGAQAVDILPSAFGSYEEGYEVFVNGTRVNEGESVHVPLETQGDAGTQKITVQVKHQDGSQSKDYVITPKFLPASEYTFSIPKEAKLEVVTNAGDGIAIPVSTTDEEEGFARYSLTLMKGMEYQYSVTQNDYYKTTGTFTAEDGGHKRVTVDTKDYVDSIAIRPTSTGDVVCGFASGEEILHELTGTIPDYVGNPYMTVTLAEGETNRTITAEYIAQTTSASYNGMPYTKVLSNGKSTLLSNFALAGGLTREGTLVIRQEDGEFTREQHYRFTLNRSLHLYDATGVTFTYGGEEALLTPEFERDVFEGYEVLISAQAKELSIRMRQAASIRADGDSPCTITVNGIEAQKAEDYESTAPWLEATIPLDTRKQEETVTIKLAHPSVPVGSESEYTFNVKKAEPVQMTFGITPEDALLTLFDAKEERLWPDEQGVFSLLSGMTYRYTLSKTGYVSQTGTFVADSAVTHMDLVLTPAEPNENIDPTQDVEWNKFRGDNNTGVTERETPMSPEDTELYWAYQSTGMSNVGQPIVLDNYVAVMTGNKLQYLDLVSGELLAEGIMYSSGGVVPVYSDGMIFCPVSSGIQAFNATPRPQTESDVGYTNKDVMVLDSLWVYKDPIGGGGVTPFYVEGGYLYGGWQQVRRDGAFVCLSITDEDPSQTHEEKVPTWRWIRPNGGFYWAGAHVGEEFVVVGGEVSGENDLTCLDAHTGEILDTIPNLFTSENRGCVSYDEGTDRYCLVTKDTFYTVRVDENGKFYDLAQGALGGASTSTPAIYNGRAYIGYSGAGQFQSFTGSGILVLDIETAQPIYAVKTQGYPQSSGLISTAYLDVPHLNPQTGQEETGFVYVYFTENISPGSISYIIDKPGITQPVLTTSIAGVEAAPRLFTPKGHHAQYNLSSLQVDKYGTLYMKTDRGYIMAIGQKVEGIEITKEPDRTVYLPGEEFDMTGIKVTAKYSNGMERDISDYVTVKDTVLQEGQTTIDILFPYALYNDETPNDYIDSNPNSTFEKLPRPSVTLPIVVLSSEQGDSVNVVMDLIDQIGTVEFDSASLVRIQKARIAYNATDPVIRKAITNYQVLLDAEKRYDMLTLASKNRLPASQVTKDASQIIVTSTGDAVLASNEAELLDAVSLNIDEMKAVENGAKIHIIMESTVLERIPGTEEFLANAALQQNKLRSTGYVLDIKVYKEIEGCDKTAIRELLDGASVTVELDVPAEHQVKGRLFYMLNIHGGSAYTLKDQASSDGGKVVFRTGKFSTYVLSYAYLPINPVNPTNPDETEPGGVIDSATPESNGGSGTLEVNVVDKNRTGSGSEENQPEIEALVSVDETLAVLPPILGTDGAGAAAGQDEINVGGQKEIGGESEAVGEAQKGTAGGNLSLILWITGIAAAVIVAGILIYRKMRSKKSA